MGASASKQHEKRITRCMQSFQQLQADIRHINLHCASEFARQQTELEVAVNQVEQNQNQNDPSSSSSSSSISSDHPQSSQQQQQPQPSDLLLLQFRPFTKLVKKSALPWLWRINDNVLIVATLTPKSVADAAIAGSLSQPPQSPPRLDPTHPSYSLTLREFYHLFLYFCDNLKNLSNLRDQILKMEHPEEWNQLQETRRVKMIEAQQQQQQKVIDAGENGDDEEEKKVPPPSSVTSHSSFALEECSICLEDGDGLSELIVLPCLHAFCRDCINDWKSQSTTCPLCRKELEDDSSSKDDEWILTTPDLKHLKCQFIKLIELPYRYVTERPVFPPVGTANKRGVKSPGDAFSLAVGEVIDVLAPTKRNKTQPTQTPAATSAAPSSASSSSSSSSSTTPPTTTASIIPVAEAITLQR